jgi:hypothetical protein
MSFRRTDSGLSTMHKFLGVDAVAFVEGGPTTFTLEEVNAGSYTAQANDLKYWQIVFSSFEPTRTVHFRAVGSKETIKEIAALITAGKITHVLAAMDRDLDHLNNSLLHGAGVFHTLGYSWENDVWTDAAVIAAFKRFSNVPDAEEAAAKDITEHFAKVRRKLRHCVRIDALLVSNRLQPLPREPLRGTVRPSKSHPPDLSATALRGLVKETTKKARPCHIVGRPATEPLRDCDGHLLEAVGYHLLVHVLRKYCRLRVTPRDLLVPAVIDSFSSLIKSDPSFINHYTPMFAATTWA